MAQPHHWDGDGEGGGGGVRTMNKLENKENIFNSQDTMAMKSILFKNFAID